MPLPSFSEKEWKKTRPDSLKDSGIAKAINKFSKICKHEASRLVEASDFIAYHDAIKVMDEAIKKAQGKTKAKGSHDEVKELLAGWKRDLDAFKQEVEQANAQAREATEQAIYNENLRKAVEEFHLIVKNNVENGFGKIERAIKSFTQAVKDKNLQVASIQYDLAQSGVDDIESNIAPKEVKYQKQFQAKRFKVNKNDMSNPADVKKWKRELKKYDGMMDKFDRAYATLEAEVMNSDPDPQDGDAETKRVIKEVQRRYKEIANEIKAKVPQAKRFARDASTLRGACQHENLSAEAITNLNRAVSAAQQINSGMLELEQAIADLLNESRNRSSPLRRKANEAGISERDQESILTPFMNVAFKNNKACLFQLRQAKNDVTDGLETLVERFDFAPAEAELKKIEKGDYKVRTGLGS